MKLQLWDYLGTFTRLDRQDGTFAKQAAKDLKRIGYKAPE